MDSRATIGLSALLTILAASARSPGQDADPQAGAAEREVMERFLAGPEETPRRGTALDWVQGHHVEHGSLDNDDLAGLVKDHEGWIARTADEGLKALRPASRANPSDPEFPRDRAGHPDAR